MSQGTLRYLRGLLIGALGFFFPSMPVSLSGIIHHSHSFTRLKIYHHIYFIFVFCPKIDFFPRGKTMVFGQK